MQLHLLCQACSHRGACALPPKSNKHQWLAFYDMQSITSSCPPN